jgi:hypothetical protein
LNDWKVRGPLQTSATAEESAIVRSYHRYVRRQGSSHRDAESVAVGEGREEIPEALEC